MTPQCTHPSAERIRTQLARIESHALFVRSARVRRFLEFTVEAVLAGKGDELKEYLLGVEVFDRTEAHDPRLDPIVRVEARRVRAKLRAYYRLAGPDELVIDYPRGSYVPQFRELRMECERDGLALIAVLPFASHPGTSGARFAEGLTREVIHELDRSGSVRILSPRRHGTADGRLEALLTGTVRKTGHRVRVTAELLSTGDTRNLWSAAFEPEPRDSLTAQKQIAFATAHALSLHFHPRSG